MVRDDLYITVPSLFRCPISLDVMRSPVSLCTGVTYDRSSIQRWLDNGNNTCPATMQVLHSKDFVPNRTLQRLIQIWIDSVRLRRVDSDNNNSPPHSSVPAKDQVLDLIQQMDPSSTTSSSDSLSEITRFARDSDENRKFLAKSDGFISLLVEVLGGNAGVDGAHGNIGGLEQVVSIIHLVRDEIQDIEELMRLMLKKSGSGDCLASLLLVLQQGSEDSQIASARVLELIAVNAEAKLLIAEKDGLLPELLKLISSPEKDPSLIEAGLLCLIAISTPKRVKVRLVHLGVVKLLWKSLSDPNSTTSTVEKVLKLLETVSSVKEGRAKICEDGKCVSAIVGRLLKVSRSATEHAVTILWSVCYLFKERTAQEAVANANGLTKMLLLMQSNCSPSVRQMSADLLKIFRVNSKSIISCYDTKTTHIMPF